MNKDMILEKINAERAELGLRALRDNEQLFYSAQERSDYLCETKTFTHDGWKEIITYDYSLAGENLAKGFGDIQAMVDAWVASPTHYKNIKEEFVHSGIGVTDCNGVYYVTQHFGTPSEDYSIQGIKTSGTGLEWLVVGILILVILVCGHIKYTSKRMSRN